ncbi:response regulator [Gorillibacterium massiliense]|uniref:response regulator n=1 Tax=Gorillibacterium massiliense TaxID=1280390 RepID=UPI0004ADF203|nr:response regulator [Gorillibacterium massiliense]
MLKVMLIDDEAPALELMKRMMLKQGDFQIVGEFTSPIRACEELGNLHPDVVFLDIEMPGMDGLETARRIKAYDEEIQIVFTTAYDQYAIQAFQVDASHYLLKPVGMKHMEIVAKKLLKIKSKLSGLQVIENRCKVVIFDEFLIQDKMGAPLKWATRKTEELFAYFLYRRGQSVDKRKLQELLWSDLDPVKAQNNLYNGIYRLRQALQKAQINLSIENHNDNYYMVTNEIDCDVYDFADFVAQNEEVSENNIQEFERIFALYKGSVFGDKDYFWSISWRQEMAGGYLHLAKKLVRYYMERNQSKQAEDKVHRVLSLYPLEEEFHQLLLLIYRTTGDRIRFIQHYETLTRLLKDELDLPPSEEIRMLYEDFVNSDTSSAFFH